jgi:hypothetical protein
VATIWKSIPQIKISDCKSTDFPEQVERNDSCIRGKKKNYRKESKK